MNRYLFRVQYTYSDDSVSYEPVCTRAETEAEALTDVTAATVRYATAVGATRTFTLVVTTADE